jgi:hypothetical protein
MSPVRVAKTEDRSVVGIMVDFAKLVPFCLSRGPHGQEGLWFVESQLAETPCYAGRSFEETVFLVAKAPELLAARWRTA